MTDIRSAEEGSRLRAVDTNIEIDVPADHVWQLLTDFPGFPDWNPLLRSIKGPCKAGARLKVSIRFPGGLPLRLRPILLEVDPGRGFRWAGRFLISGLIDGEHTFRIEPRGDSRAVFIQREVWSGILAPLLWPVFSPLLHNGFTSMNKALKIRLESQR